MHLITDLKPALARLTKLSTLAVASTALAAAATTWLITGTLNPAQWLAAYEHSRQPAVVHLQQNHEPAAVRAAASPAAPDTETPPPSAPPASNPAPAAAEPASTHDDDGYEGGDD